MQNHHNIQDPEHSSPNNIEIEDPAKLVSENSSVSLIPKEPTAGEARELKIESTISDQEKYNWNPVEKILKSRIQKKLLQSNLFLIAFCSLSSFIAYFANYGLAVFVFARTYNNQEAFGMQLKVAFTIAQMLGYGLSKVAGTIIMPTLTRKYRCRLLMLGTILAELCLVVFGFANQEVQVLMVFLNGVPLAWTWGLMVMYVEGRRISELLIISLYLSVMIASGCSKSLAIATIEAGIDENWMPAFCGAISTVLCLICFNLLDAIPEPTHNDVQLRNERKPITSEQRKKFFKDWGFGLFAVTIVYSVLTATRNFRDYFSPEIFGELLQGDFDASTFTKTELPIGIATTAAFSLLYVIKDDKKGFFVLLGLMIFGSSLIGLSTLLYYLEKLSPMTWIIVAGTGIFIAYIPPGASFYDRLNGATGVSFTSVFMMYFSDLFGYAATLTILFYRNFGPTDLSYAEFFEKFAFGVSAFAVFCLSIAFVYFFVKLRKIVPKKPSVDEIAMKEVLESKQTINS